MYKVISAFCLVLATCMSSFPQSSDDYNKNEFFVGFSHEQVGDSDVRRRFNGFNASYVRNVSRFFGIKGDVSGAYKKNSIALYNFLGGVQIKDNASKKRLQPFAHALVGVGHNRNKVNARTFHDTGFAGAFGGGLDIKVNEKFSVRAIQIDYNPIYSNQRVDNNVRFGVGIVFKY